MTELSETLIAEIRGNISRERTHENDLLASSKRIEELLSNLLGVNKSVDERYILHEYTIPKDDFYSTPTIDSSGFEKARIFVSVGFTENTTGGVLIDLYYSGHRIGVRDIMEINPDEAAMSAGSESFDINRLSGFNFVIRNTDVGQEVKINTLKIVLYNE